MTDAVLAPLVGRTIRRIRRANYVLPDGGRERREGPVELSLDDGSVMLLDSGADGESLRVRAGEWRDPFPEPLIEENRAFLAEAGRWTAFDVSADEDYHRLIGSPIREVRPKEWHGRTIGVDLVTPGGTLAAEVVADELHVDVITRGGGSG